MIRNLRTRLVTAIPIACAISSSAVAQIRVEVDGNLVNFSDTQPRMIDGRVLVPLRGVLEQMGANVFWDPSRRLVTAKQGPKDISLYIGQRSALVDGRSVPLDVPAMIIGGSTMVPLRFMSESLGADVMWLSSSKTVRIDTALDAREPSPPPKPGKADISSFEVESPNDVLRTGAQINLELRGTPGANVVFSIPGLTGKIGMAEYSPGFYTATWTVPAKANRQRVSAIVAELSANGVVRRMRAG